MYEPGVRAKDKMTVREFSEEWLDDREGDVITIKLDRTRFREHILPAIGHLRVAEVEAWHLVDFLKHLRRKESARTKKLLSKNTIRNVWANVVTMFADAQQQDYTYRNPCLGLRKEQRPRKATRAETQGVALDARTVSLFVSDPRIPFVRRVLYGLLFLAGTRFGEAAGFRWTDYDPHREPLGRLRLVRQYEDRPLKGRRGQPGPPRDIPVHPTLAALLAEWKLSGFAAHVGRSPEPDDPIAPTERGKVHTHRAMAYWIAKDAKRIGLDIAQATHVARRTFITMAMAGGASEAWVRRITHNANGDVLTGYQVNDWPAMCRVMDCVPVRRQPLAQVTQLPAPTSASGTPNEVA